MGVTGLWDILRPAGKPRSLTHIAVVDGFEANPNNVRGLRIGIDASIWFFHAAHGREGENPELRTLFFRCTRLMSAPFLPLFVFDGPKRPKVKRGKRISGEKHWLVDGMKGMIEAFGFEWRMAPGEAEAELAHLNSIGVIDAIVSDDVDNFLFGAKVVIRNPSVTLTGNNKHNATNADGRVDGNHSTIYTSAEILAHPSVQLTRGGTILIGLLSGGDYHPAGLARCGIGIAHGLAKCGFGDELLEATKILTRDELPAFLDKWRDGLRSELRTNSRGHLGTKKPSLAKAVPDSFPDIDILLSYTNPITSATDAGARRTHTPPKWVREPDLGKIAHVCELHFEWGLKDIIIKRFRTVLWPSIVLRALRRSVLEADATSTIEPPSTPVKQRVIGRDAFGTPSKMLARHFSSMEIGQHDDKVEDGLGELIVKIHSSRNHAYTDGILEYRLEIAPSQLVRLASAGIQGLRKPADTTYDVEASDLDDDDDDDDEPGAKKKRRNGPPPDPESHLRVWMPACMVELVRPDLVDQFEAKQEAKRSKKVGK
ncbi:PIN domain-like protein, partial [Gloeopeniophorella convolvens]